MTVDDAFNHLVTLLKGGRLTDRNGYDVYIDDVVDGHLINSEHLNRDARGDRFQERAIEVAPFFLTAAWELCRRGVLRPGLRDGGQGGIGNNLFGKGYSVTPQGRTWIQDADYEQLASVIPGRFVALLSAHTRRFGPGFLSRGVEALRCYNAHAFLGCCAMCGAAAESILLALAGEQKDPAAVLTMYQGTAGRSRVQNLLIGKANGHVQGDFQRYMSLLSYWRDEAAHGRDSKIGEEEAFTSLLSLLRLARYADETFPL